LVDANDDPETLSLAASCTEGFLRRGNATSSSNLNLEKARPWRTWRDTTGFRQIEIQAMTKW
jgi:hypothetical protein